MQTATNRSQQDPAGAASRRESDRELLTEFAGADIADKLTDDECATLKARILQLIRSMRQKDFDAGWACGIDHAVDCVGALCAQNAKSH